MNERWFANRGQIIQVIITAIACFIAGIKAFPDFRRSDFFTVGTLVFVFVAVSVVLSIVQLGKALQRHLSIAPQQKPPENLKSAPRSIQAIREPLGEVVIPTITPDLARENEMPASFSATATICRALGQ